MFLTVCLYACSPFAPDIKEHGVELVPQYYSLYSNDIVPDDALNWWRDFDDAELDRIIDLALAENLDVLQAWARLNQLSARYRQAFGGLLPSIDLDGGYSAERRQTDTRAGSATTVLANYENYNLGLFVSYELDLWGRVDASVKSGRLSFEAGRDDLDAVRESIAAAAASLWIQIIAARQELALLQKQLNTNEKYLDLVELRYASGMVTALDVFQQRQTVARTKTQIPLAEKNIRLLENDLKLLLGQPADYPLQISRTDLPVLTALPKTGLPAELLQNRPDVRAAGKRLYAAQWGVTEARANRLPAIRLSAGIQGSSNDLTYLFNNWIGTLAANLTAPIFHGGALAAEVEYQRALADENLQKYKQTVLTAVNEVEAALWSERAQRDYLANLIEQKTAAQHALDEATFHYINGLNSYLPVLTQLAAVQDLEITAVQQQAQLLINRVTMYRALGGNFGL